MGYRLYIETLGGKEILCGGKLYGYDEYDKDIRFHGFMELLKTSGDACADLLTFLADADADYGNLTAFEFIKSVIERKPDFERAIRSMFECQPPVEYTITKEQTARFIGRYLLDFMSAHGRQAAFEMKGTVPELTEECYVIRWF